MSVQEKSLQGKASIYRYFVILDFQILHEAQSYSKESIRFVEKEKYKLMLEYQKIYSRNITFMLKY